MIKIYSPIDELELAMIRGILDTEGIGYFIHNDNFGSMRVGPQIDLRERYKGQLFIFHFMKLRKENFPTKP